MKRRVIQIGNSTQLVSLPRQWTLDLGIKKGDELDVTSNGDRVVITTANEAPFDMAKLKFTTKDRFLARPIHTLYKMGYDEIHVEFDDPQIIDLLQHETENLLGLEIVDHRPNTCIIRNVAKAMESELDSILRRVQLMIQDMAKDATDAIINKDYDLLNEIEKREHRVDKLVFFVQRLLIKTGYKDQKKTSFVYETTSLLENVADDYRRLCQLCIESQPTLQKSTIKYLESVRDLLDAHRRLFYSPSLAELRKFKELHRKTRKEARNLLTKPSPKDALVLHYILTINERINNMTESIEYRF